MAQTKVTPETMNTLATGIEGKMDDWSTAVTTIYQLIAEMDAMWDGDANDAFNQRMQDNRQKFNRLAQVMSEYVQAIKKAASNYASGEAEVSQIVKR